MGRQLVSTHYPYLPLNPTIVLGQGRVLQPRIEALLDTGFTGDIAVPEALLGDVAGTPDAYASLRLADGSSTFAAVYQGYVFFYELEDDVHVRLHVTILAMGEEPLVGRGLMDRFRVTLDHGRRLIIEL